MAAELIRKLWCDRCLTDEDKRVDATVSETVVLGNTVREIDLCERCATDLLEPIQEVLRLGRTPDEPSTPIVRPKSHGSSEDYNCPICRVSFKTRQTFRGHLKKDHGMGFGEYLKSIGKEAFPCAEKSCEFVGVDSAGLALHHVRMHNLVSANGHKG